MPLSAFSPALVASFACMYSVTQACIEAHMISLCLLWGFIEKGHRSRGVEYVCRGMEAAMLSSQATVRDERAGEESFANIL